VCRRREAYDLAVMAREHHDSAAHKRRDFASERWMRHAFSRAEDHADSFLPDNWAKEGDPDDGKDRLWKQYGVLTDLYKYYLDIAWKAAVWYYATTGVVLAYYFDNYNAEEDSPLPFLLLFVGIMSLGFAYLAWRGARNLSGFPLLLEHIACNLRIPGRPHVEFSVIFLLMNSGMFVLVGLGSLGLFVAASISASN
jgi:hypothetical protein